MQTCLIIGAKGFIGSAVTAEAINRNYAVTAVDLDNDHEFKGTTYDLIINAAGNSRKFIDDENPAQGFDLSVTSVFNLFQDFSARFFIHLSSGSVYPDEGAPAKNMESTVLVPAEMTNYGFNKYLAEQVVRHYAENHLILRMGGFVGPGLKKNAVFDLLTGRSLFVHPDSEFQYMDTRELAHSVFTLYEAGMLRNSILNLSSNGTISIREVAQIAGVHLPDGATTQPRVRAELNVDAAARYLSLPTTGDTIDQFITDIQAGRILLA